MDRDRLRASVLLQYLRAADVTYSAESKMLVIRFERAATAGWCWEALGKKEEGT